MAVFNGLQAWFYRKLVVLRNLEAKFLKTENLQGVPCGREPGAIPRVSAEKKLIRTG